MFCEKNYHNCKTFIFWLFPIFLTKEHAQYIITTSCVLLPRHARSLRNVLAWLCYVFYVGVFDNRQIQKLCSSDVYLLNKLLKASLNLNGNSKQKSCSYRLEIIFAANIRFFLKTKKQSQTTNKANTALTTFTFAFLATRAVKYFGCDPTALSVYFLSNECWFLNNA